MNIAQMMSDLGAELYMLGRGGALSLVCPLALLMTFASLWWVRREIRRGQEQAAQQAVQAFMSKVSVIPPVVVPAPSNGGLLRLLVWMVMVLAAGLTLLLWLAGFIG
jgi:hypothetical protein